MTFRYHRLDRSNAQDFRPCSRWIHPRRPRRAGAAYFRTNTNAVLLDLRVIDRGGHFVPDLTRDDFRVEEDGIEQSIATFELVNIPLAAPVSPPTFAGRTVDPDAASNEHSEGRVYVILLDDLNMHPLRTPTARGCSQRLTASRRVTEWIGGNRSRRAIARQ